jgi:CheY-like chemotaxis protein
MPAAEELNRLRISLAELDAILAGLTDFRSFPDVLTDDDPQVQGIVERTILAAREARDLTAQMHAGLEALDVAGVTAVPIESETLAPGAPAKDEPVPAEILPRIAPPAHLEQITMANPTGMRELILIADHDAAGLADMEGMLTEEDYRVLSARDGFEAISIYARLWAAIDLVILDFSLPGMSGDLVFDELQAINPKVAAVVSSGFTHPDKLKQMLAQGLSGFLPKPYERGRLLRQIQQVLAHRPAAAR